MNTTHDLLMENAKLSARVAELEAERDQAREWLGAANNEFGSAAWDWPDLWRRISQIKELSNDRWRRAKDAEAALATAEMNCRSLEAMTEDAIHRMDAAQAEVKRLRALAIDIVASYPAERHGSLPLDPHKAAAQVRDELVATLTRALSEGGE